VHLISEEEGEWACLHLIQLHFQVEVQWLGEEEDSISDPKLRRPEAAQDQEVGDTVET